MTLEDQQCCAVRCGGADQLSNRLHSGEIQVEVHYIR